MFDGEAFGKEMVAIVREYVASELEPLRAENKALADANAELSARITELEARKMPEAIKGDPGEVDMEAVKALIDEAVAAIELPTAEKGEPGEPGRDVDMAEVAERIEQAVKAAVEALPAPKQGEAGKDGIGLADALIDREGALVLTMTDGTTKSLGKVHGKDGADGKDGETFTLDDFDIEAVDERVICLKFTKGDTCHSFELEFPVPVYRGVWREGEYQRGDMVTWGGDLWHAEKATAEKPATADWKLAVRKGRDAK